MKTKNLLVAMLPLFAFLFSLVSCSKDSDTTTPPVLKSTSLEIVVFDASSHPLSSASVSLYKNFNDWAAGTNQVGSTQTTDADGKTTFKGLSPIQYYFQVEKGCQNNIIGTNSTSGGIIENITNTATVTLVETGFMKFLNTSSFTYHVYVNGTYYKDFPGGTTEIHLVPIVPLYTIRVVEVSGSDDNTYTGSIVCGQTLNVTFP